MLDKLRRIGEDEIMVIQSIIAAAVIIVGIPLFFGILGRGL